MSQEFGAFSPSQPRVPLSWTETWIKAVTRPSVTTYEEIVNDPAASSGRAYAWVFITALIGYGFTVISQQLVNIALDSATRGREAPTGAGPFLLVLFCGVPILSLLSVLGLMFGAGVTNLIASILGGTGTYSKLVYAFAAYYAPLTLISSVLNAIPFINYLAFPLGLYAIALNLIAIKAVHQFG